MFDKQILRLDGARAVLAFCIFMSMFKSILIVIQAVALSMAIVNVWGGESPTQQIPEIAFFAAAFIGRELVRCALDARMEKYAHLTAAKMRIGLLEAIYANGVSISAEYGTASIVTTLVDGIERVESYIALVLPKVVALIIVPLCLAIAIFAQDLISGIIVLVCYPFIIIFMRLIGYTASDESAKRHDDFMRMSNHFLDSLRGMETLRTFGVSQSYSKSIFVASERYREQIMKTLRIAQLSGAVLDLFATCGLAAVAIMLGFRLVEGSIVFLPALIVLMLVPEYFIPIKAYAADYHASLDGKTSLASILNMLDLPRRKVDLRNMPRIEYGETVVVTGKTGSGKTTLLDAIAGFIEMADGDVSAAKPGDSARTGRKNFSVDFSRIAYISQTPTIFTGSIRENVALYNAYASDNAINDALKKVGLSPLIDSLPEGLETKIGREGRALSGGEAHRIALARALVDPKRDIWLLDEPGSNLDVETEYDLKQAILPLMEGRTTIIATHRSHWLENADRHIEVKASRL